MRSFLGRDILSLKDFERNEFFRIFEIAEILEPIARNRRNTDLLKEKTLVTAFYVFGYTALGFGLYILINGIINGKYIHLH